MGELTLINGTDWKINDKLQGDLDILLHAVKYKKMDLVIVLDGAEGIGKSFGARGLGMYCASRLNCDFSIKDIHFDLDDYISDCYDAFNRDAIRDEHGGITGLKRFKINVLDESRAVLNRSRSTSRSNVRFTNFISECRMMQQVHILVLPAYHDLDKYIVNWRMSFVIHFIKRYNEKDNYTLVRGFYNVYMKDDWLFYCYNNRKKGYKYPTKPYIHGARWSSTEVFSVRDLQLYDAKKFESSNLKYNSPTDEVSKTILNKLRKELESDLETTHKTQFCKALKIIQDRGLWSVKKMALEFGLTVRATNDYLRHAKDNPINDDLLIVQTGPGDNDAIAFDLDSDDLNVVRSP